MLQYLLNATTVWLICLLVYDLFLSRETYHAYNRVYLNLCLLLGLLLPLWHWDNKSTVITGDVFIQSAKQASAIKQTIVNVVPEPSAVLNIYSIIWFAYLIGVAIAAVFIVKELRQLMGYYKEGTRYNTTNFTIVETGKEHSPFSLFKTVYVRSRKEFTDEQWELLLTHEMQHGRLLHSLDKCFMLLLRIVLWFHPLVYLYYRRMMIIHEYQADAPYKEKASEYGSFLLEQSLLQQAPIIVHSFNYSPIKNRISMLTRKNSSKIKLAKYLVVIPLTIALLVCCTNYGFSTGKEKKGNKIYFKGNTFETNEPVEAQTRSNNSADTVVHVTILAYPIKMNGKDIVSDSKVTSKPYMNGSNEFDELIFNAIKPELNKLADADNYQVRLFNLIIDEKGKLVYYDIQGIAQSFNHVPSDDEIVKIDPKVKESINEILTKVFESDLSFTPAMKDGKPVICTIDPFKWGEKFVVKNHVATFVRS